MIDSDDERPATGPIQPQAMDRKYHYFTVAQLRRELPVTVSKATILRWINAGIKRKDGDRVVMKGTKIGGVMYSTIHYYHEFIEELNK